MNDAVKATIGILGVFLVQYYVMTVKTDSAVAQNCPDVGCPVEVCPPGTMYKQGHCIPVNR